MFTGHDRTRVGGTRRLFELDRASIGLPSPGVLPGGTGLRGTHPLTTGRGTRVSGDTHLFTNGTTRRGVRRSHELFGNPVGAPTASEHVDDQGEPIEHLEPPRVGRAQAGFEETDNVELVLVFHVGPTWWRVVRGAVVHDRSDGVGVPGPQGRVLDLPNPTLGEPGPAVRHQSTVDTYCAGTPTPAKDRTRVEILVHQPEPVRGLMYGCFHRVPVVPAPHVQTRDVLGLGRVFVVAHDGSSVQVVRGCGVLGEFEADVQLIACSGQRVGAGHRDLVALQVPRVANAVPAEQRLEQVLAEPVHHRTALVEEAPVPTQPEPAIEHGVQLLGIVLEIGVELSLRHARVADGPHAEGDLPDMGRAILPGLPAVPLGDRDPPVLEPARSDPLGFHIRRDEARHAQDRALRHHPRRILEGTVRIEVVLAQRPGRAGGPLDLGPRGTHVCTYLVDPRGRPRDLPLVPTRPPPLRRVPHHLVFMVGKRDLTLRIGPPLWRSCPRHGLDPVQRPPRHVRVVLAPCRVPVQHPQPTQHLADPCNLESAGGSRVLRAVL